MPRSFSLSTKSKIAGPTGSQLTLQPALGAARTTTNMVHGLHGYAVRGLETDDDGAGSPSDSPGAGSGFDAIGWVGPDHAADVAFEIESAEAPHFRIDGLTSI